METCQYQLHQVKAIKRCIFLTSSLFPPFSVQNMLIQDSETYRKQYEESIQEKVGCRDRETITSCFKMSTFYMSLA